MVPSWFTFTFRFEEAQFHGVEVFIKVILES